MVTIYRNLKLLVQVGMVCELQSGQNEHCYTRYRGAHHHHLICQACARVIDVGSCDISSLESDLAKKTGFDIREHRLEFYGLCRHCQKDLRKQERKMKRAPFIIMALILFNTFSLSSIS